jgi:alpha-1,6-mannosyltransferase
MSIKTLHLTNYWHARSSGITTFYRQLIETANRLQRCAILVVPGERNEVEESGAFCRIYKIAAPHSPLNRDYRTIYPGEFLLPESKLKHILAVERPDLVEICDKYSLVHLGPLLRLHLMRRLNLRPVVVGLTCERMDENFDAYVTRSWWGRYFTRSYMHHVYFPAFDHHIAVSENTAAELRAVANGHIVPRGTWIRPMGVDVGSFSPLKRSPEVRRRLLGCDSDGSTLLLLYVGRLAPEKNLGLLIATLAELEKATAFPPPFRRGWDRS